MISYGISVRWHTNSIQLAVAVISLLLLLIGLFSIVKKRLSVNVKDKTIVDMIVTKQSTIKTIEFAKYPLKQGEEIGEFIIESCKGGKKIVNKIKNLFDKYKGYMLGFLTFIGAVAMQLSGICGDLLVVKGINVLEVIIYIMPIIIMAISNPNPKTINEAIKTFKDLFSKDAELLDKMDKIVNDPKKEQIKILEDKLANWEEMNAKMVEKYTTLKEANAYISQELINEHNGYVTAKNKILNDIEILKK